MLKKNNYIFLDDEDDRKEIQKLNEIKNEINLINNDEINIWIFQANPKDYDILNALSDENIGNNIHWGIRRHKNKIKNGNIGLIWMSGKEAGIYAVTLITSDPEFTDEYPQEQKYWLNSEKGIKKLLRVNMLVIKRLLNNPIFRNDLKNIKGLEHLSILRNAQGTNFPVKKLEWGIISNLIDDKY